MTDKFGNSEINQDEFSADIQRLATQMQKLVRSLGTVEGGNVVGFSFTVLTQDAETRDTHAFAHAWFGAFLHPSEITKTELLADAWTLSCVHTRALESGVHEALENADCL